MTIILPIPTSSLTQLESTTTTASDIIQQVSKDVRGQLDWTVTDEANLLLSFLNRVQLEILREKNWSFLLKGPYYFITEREQSNYWLGPSGSAPAGTIETSLNLTDLDRIEKTSVIDNSSGRQLGKVATRPFGETFTTQDAQFQRGAPIEWDQDESNPYILSLYPAPLNNNTYQPTPMAPQLTRTIGGALSARIYYVVITFVDSLGNEGTPSRREAIIDMPASQLMVVQSPLLPFNGTTFGATYSQYNVYASTSSNTWVRQTASPITIGTNWTEPGSGLIAGVSPPTSSNLVPMDGFLMSFSYFKQRPKIIYADDILQIPDVYFDIMVAGTNWLACLYLRMKDEAAYWRALFEKGKRDMISDTEEETVDYIMPDPAAI